MRANTFALSSLLIASAAGCMQSGGSSPTNETVGGSVATGGTSSTLTSISTGGATSSAGASSVGGNPATGGVANTGGNVPVGGKSNTGGAATGGNVSTGGNAAVGGNVATGGSAAVGGNLATGGAANTGGVKSTGGVSATGGSKSVGGASATGGMPTTGGGSTTVASTGGTTSVGGGSSASYYGYQPVPSSQNTANFNPATWYTTWKTNMYVDCGGGQARITNNPGAGNPTFSEGIGYGMLLAVGNGDRTALDALWAYYKAHEDANGLMNWQTKDCGATIYGQNGATDGDEDTAMALVQADAKWGGYKTDATALINAIKKYETAAGPPSYLLPGDAIGGWSAGTVNPSYFAPGYWHVWATYVSDPFWNQLATDAYTMLAAYQKLTISNSTGLVPEWGTSQGQVSGGADYGYNACRTPWRVAVDYVWFQTAAAQTFLQNVSTFVDSKGGVASVPFDKNSAFLGPFALSGMAVSQAKADAYLNSWLSAQMDDTPYFQGSIRGLCLLVANRNFPKGS